MSTNIKKRNWAFVLYPESAPEDWREQLQSIGVQAVISPLHDKDINPTGEPKKAHYHIIVHYENPSSFNNVCKCITEPLGQPIPIPLESAKGYYRYLTHKDNPEKAQYNESDITSINGFNPADLLELTQFEVTHLKIEIQSLIRNLDITEYAELMDYLLDNDQIELYSIASNNTVFFNRYICSRRESRKASPVS